MGTVLGFVGVVVSAGLLLGAIGRFRRDWREGEILRAPAVSRQVLHVPVAGQFGLFVEGPRYRAWGKRYDFRLYGADSGRPVPITPCLSGAGVRTPRRSRVQRGRFALDAPGAYTLEVDGLAVGDEATCAIVLMRPMTRRVIGFVLTIVALCFCLIGSLVLAILSLVL